MSGEVTYSSIKGNRPPEKVGGSSSTTKPSGLGSSAGVHINTPKSQASLPPKEGLGWEQKNSAPINNRQDKYLLYKKLPYVKRRMDFGVWIYRNRYGVIATVFCYIIAMFAFGNIRFDITTMEQISGFFVELPEEEKPEPKPEEPKPKEPEITNQQIMDDIKNIAVNEDAKLDGGLKDDRGTQASDIYKEAQELQDRMAASKAAYDQANADDAAYLDEMRKSLQRQGNNDTKREDSRISGNVTISWSLDGRSAVYIHNPAYRCEGAGSVTVAITVDRNGRVVDAEVSKISRSNDNCLIDMAIEAAELTKFNVSSNAPEKQKGTITYIFMAQ